MICNSQTVYYTYIANKKWTKIFGVININFKKEQSYTVVRLPCFSTLGKKQWTFYYLPFVIA